MKHKSIVIMPLASTLGALGGSAMVAAEAKPGPTTDAAVNAQAEPAQSGQRPNTLFSAGESLFGFVVTEKADRTIVAQHASHASHASHTSHASSHH